MPTQPPPIDLAPDSSGDDIPFRAVRDAALIDREPLTRLQRFVIAGVAVGRAAPYLDQDLTETQRYAELSQIAKVALDLAASGADGKYLVRARLVGGIEALPNHHQIALSLRFEHDMKNKDIASVMGITVAELRYAYASAFEALWGGM